MRIIPSNTSTATLRRIFFTLVDATDKITPEDIVTTGVKVTLSFDGGTPTPSTNDVVKVDGLTGQYYIELSQAESNQLTGTQLRGWLQPVGCALTLIEAQIVTANQLAAVVDANTTTVAANAITATSIQNGALTAAKFAAGAFDAVWAVTTRSLTTFGSLVADIWNVATSTLTTAGSIGNFIVNNTGGSGGSTDWTPLEREQIRNRLGIDGSESAPVSGIPTLALSSTVTSIKTKTDQLVFTKTNELDVNLQSINGETLVGDGKDIPFDVA